MKAFNFSVLLWIERFGFSILIAFFLQGCESGGGGRFDDGHDYGSNDPNLYVAMGDSITAGYGLTSYSQSFVPRLSSMLGKTIINKGHGGDESSRGAGTVNSVLKNYKPGVLLIFYGVNDLICGRSVESAIANLQTMILAAKVNKTIPVIATLTPAFGSHSFIYYGVAELSDRIRALADAEGICVADLNDTFGDNSAYILPDGLHPNSLGHELIALTFNDILQ